MPSETISIAAVIGFIMPPVIDAINRSHWSAQIRGVMAFVLCAVAAVGVAWWQNTLGDWGDLRTTLLTLFGSAIFFYNMYWKTSGLSQKIMDKTG